MRIVVALAVVVSLASVARAQCVVSGEAQDVRDVLVRAGSQTLRIDVDRGNVAATLPARATAPTSIEVRGYARFTGSVHPRQLTYVIGPATALGHGVLRVSSRLAFGSLRDVRSAGGAALATFDDSNVRIRNVEVPCTALTLDDGSQFDAFQRSFDEGAVRTVRDLECDRPIRAPVLTRVGAAATELRRTVPSDVRDYDEDRSPERLMLRTSSSFVRASPDVREGVRIEVRDPRWVPFEAIERREAWTHVRLRWRDGSVLEGWIASRGLRPYRAPSEGRLGTLGSQGSGGGSGTSAPTGPARLRVGASLYASVGGAAWATVEGTETATVYYQPPGPWVAVHQIPRLSSRGTPIAWARRDDVTFGVSDHHGLILREQTPGSAGPIIVEQAAPDSPAYAAGLRTGDRIVRIEGMPESWVSLDDIRRELAGGGRISVERAGRVVPISIPSRPGCENRLHSTGPYVCCSF